MNIFFYGENSSVDWWEQEFSQASVRFIGSSEELLDAVKKEDGDKLVFLDFDYKTEETVELDKKISSMGIIRIVFSEDLKALKEYQKSENAAHGYVKKPLSREVVEETVRNFFPDENVSSRNKGGIEQAIDKEPSYDLVETVTSVIEVPEHQRNLCLERRQMTWALKPLRRKRSRCLNRKGMRQRKQWRKKRRMEQ